jgi:hypothetical protein
MLGSAVDVDTICPKLPAAVKFALVVFQTSAAMSEVGEPAAELAQILGSAVEVETICPKEPAAVKLALVVFQT